MTNKPMCPCIRDATKGVKGGCRRAARKKFGGACCAEHQALLAQWVGAEMPAYTKALTSAKNDPTGVIAGRMRDMRNMLLVVQSSRLEVAAEAEIGAEDALLLAAAEAARATRKAAENTASAQAMAGRKRAVMESQEVDEEPRRVRRNVRLGTANEGGEEYGGGKGDADEEYADEVDGDDE